MAEAATSEVNIEIELTEPIIAYGEEVKTLKIRKPTGADLVAVGNPVKMSPYTDPPSVEHDFKKVVAMLARLTNLPSTSLDKMSVGDLVRAAWEISPFFL